MSLTGRVSHPRQVMSVGDAVEVTVVELDVEKRRIGLSMVERARREQETAEAEERRDTEAHLAKDDAASLGTLGDLLRKR
jgi:small subunit ribosomal protein S1